MLARNSLDRSSNKFNRNRPKREPKRTNFGPPSGKAFRKASTFMAWKALAMGKQVTDPYEVWLNTDSDSREGSKLCSSGDREAQEGHRLRSSDSGVILEWRGSFVWGIGFAVTSGINGNFPKYDCIEARSVITCVALEILANPE